jgi:hypothetical protein
LGLAPNPFEANRFAIFGGKHVFFLLGKSMGKSMGKSFENHRTQWRIGLSDGVFYLRSPTSLLIDTRHPCTTVARTRETPRRLSQ